MRGRKKVLKNLRKEIPALAEKIQPIYNFLNWEWFMRGRTEIPGIVDICVALEDLIKRLEENPYIKRSESGGLYVEVYKDVDLGWIGRIGFHIYREIG